MVWLSTRTTEPHQKSATRRFLVIEESRPGSHENQLDARRELIRSLWLLLIQSLLLWWWWCVLLLLLSWLLHHHCIIIQALLLHHCYYASIMATSLTARSARHRADFLSRARNAQRRDHISWASYSQTRVYVSCVLLYVHDCCLLFVFSLVRLLFLPPAPRISVRD